MTKFNSSDFGLPVGLDLSKLKAKFEEEKSKSKNGFANSDNRFVRLVDGKTTVRILPPYKKDKIEYYEGFLNHRINNQNIVCLRERKYTPVAPCPICKLANTLYKGDDADKKVGKLFVAQEKYYYNVVVKGVEPISIEQATKDEIDLTPNPEEIKILSTGKKLKEKINSYIFESDYGDITNVFEGYDFVVKRKKVKIEDGRTIPNYDDSYPKKDSSPLAETPEKIKEILGKMFDLHSIVEEARKTPAEMLEFLEKFCTEQLNNPDIMNLLVDKKSSRVSVPNNPIATNAKKESVEDTVSLSEVEGAEDYKPEVTAPAKKAEKPAQKIAQDLDDFDKDLLSAMEDGD